MREILFRGKRLDNGEWVEGDLVHSVYKIGDTCVGTYGSSLGMHQVDPSTVGQYTGIRDKNGERIFEGDIVKGRYSGKVAAVQAEVWNCGCCHGVLGFSTETCDPDLGDTLVVIGNIHDNPEMLEVADGQN